MVPVYVAWVRKVEVRLRQCARLELSEVVPVARLEKMVVDLDRMWGLELLDDVVVVL